MCKIRRAVPGDTVAIIEVWEDAVLATHDFLDPVHFEMIKAQIPVHLGALDVYVYEQLDGIIGFVGVAGGKIEALFVRDRGKGIGRKLLDFVVNDLGAYSLDVNEQNPAARVFYEKYGFRQNGRSATDASGMPYPILHLELK